jgi:hypothetical protein
MRFLISRKWVVKVMDITVKLVLSKKIYVCHSRNLLAGIQKNGVICVKASPSNNLVWMNK